jgi:UDP-glucose 4-epimerase
MPRVKAAVLGAGFIGLNFLRFAQKTGYELSVLDHKSPPPDLEGSMRWKKGHFENEADVEEAINRVDCVFHFISSTVPGDKVDIAEELRQNVFQTLQLMSLCMKQDVKKIVFLSSASVYGVQHALPIPETAPTNPISAHGIHKLTIEKYLQLHSFQNDIDCKIVRLSNPYGPGQDIFGRQGFIAILIGKLISGTPITIRGDGRDVRDYVYIDDVCTVLDRIAISDSRTSLLNVGSGIGYSLNEIVRLAREITGLEVPVEYSPGRAADIPESVLDVSRAKALFGTETAWSMREGFARTLESNGIRCPCV